MSWYPPKTSRLDLCWDSLRNAARLRDYPVTITFAQYKQLVSGAVCHYCSGPLPRAGSGVDRIDSALGYVPGNVVPCCTKCNRAKNCANAAGFTAGLVHEAFYSCDGSPGGEA